MVEAPGVEPGSESKSQPSIYACVRCFVWRLEATADNLLETLADPVSSASAPISVARGLAWLMAACRSYRRKLRFTVAE